MTAVTARAGAPPGQRNGPGVAHPEAAPVSSRPSSPSDQPIMPDQGASFDLLRAPRHERRIWWGGYETGHRHGLADGYDDGRADGHREGWVARDRASLDDAAAQWAALGKATTAGPTEAELQRLRSPEAARAHRIAVRDPASRNDVHSRADLVRVCVASWGNDW